jgi:prepilin-type N-terminal cleavage/methylation domain-containing protein
MKAKWQAFTLVELLTVLAIIAMLLSLILPAMDSVRTLAKNTKQEAQLNSIGLAITAFRHDYGDYPPSTAYSDGLLAPDYSGGQKLAEALLGRDLLGFHPQSNWNAIDPTFYGPATVDERKGHYLELGTASAFKLVDLFVDATPLAPDTHVMCDVFGVKEIVLGGRKVKAGTPILYYRANTSSKTISLDEPAEWKFNIYDYEDNVRLINVVDDDPIMGTGHPLDDNPAFFYGEYIRDPKIAALPWPYRPSSYLLITAGKDGLYGTTDDITNFRGF